MEEFEQMIGEARIMLRSSDPEQRERGREKLREVIRAADGGTHAQEARLLLAQDAPPAPRPNDPELDKLAGLWPSIQGFNDHRLADFLKQLEAYPGMAVPLRTEVIRELRKWIADALPQMRTGMSPAQVVALNEFVAAVRGGAAYEELPEFKQLRDGLFYLRLQETAARVDEALGVWALDEAQRLLDELGPLPDVFKPNVERLQKDVYEVDSLCRGAQALLRHLPAEAPDNWSKARLGAESLEQLSQYLADERVPQDWRDRLEEGRVRLAASVGAFVRAQGLAAMTIQQLRDFQTEFERLSVEGPAGRWEVGEDWFPLGLETLAAEAGRRVERARNPDELTAVVNSLREDIEGLPPSVAARVGEWADAVGRNTAAWKDMRDGKSFELPAAGPSSLQVPTAFRTEAAQYAAWLHQIETALSDLKGETQQLTGQDYESGLRLAEEILEQAPGHSLARKLRLEAARRISCYQLDRALTGWNLESFFELLRADNPGEIYAALAAGKEAEALSELGALARQSPLADWRAAAQWWADWRATSRRLPSAKPDALWQAMAQQSAARRQEWYAALERLLKDDLAPQEYEAAAAPLEDADEADTNLRTYQQELRRKATIGRIEQHIKNARLDEAEQELRKLPPGSTDAERLRTHLMMAQARGRGSAAGAEFLCSEWNNVQRHVDRPHAVLLETVQAVWAEDLQDWLNRLEQLLSRVLAREEKDDATARELAEWQTWLEIESGLMRGSSSGGVKQLADYLRAVRPGELLDRRLKKLLCQWEAENNTVMLAWAYQSFRPKSAAAEPFGGAADGLLAESDRVAEQVLGELAERPTLELDDLKRLHESLQREEQRWQSLKDFLGLLAHPVEHRGPAANFARAKASVGELSRILAALARVREADLRQKDARLDFEDAYARARRLKGVAGRERLLGEFERLVPLLDLFSLEQRIRETAERCRSKDALDVLEPGLFAALADYVKKVDETFVRAEAKGGAMWQLVSAEYEALVYREACVGLPPSGRPGLDELAATLVALHEEEVGFTQAIASLEDRDRQPKVPWGGAFDPEPHLEYLRLIPAQAPRSLKVFHRFDRARRDTVQHVLEARESRPHLPSWVREYLDKGVPACPDEH
jgi:hypothetical protein